MKVVLSNPTLNSNVQSAALGLNNAGILGDYYISAAVSPGSLLDRLGDWRFLSAIRRRRFNPSLKKHVKIWPWLEAGRHIAQAVGFNCLTQKESAIFSINSININFDKHVAASLKDAKDKAVKALYSFEDVASFSFQKAKEVGLKCLYELPIGYWRNMHQLLAAEKERWPGWENTIPGFDDSCEKLERKDKEISLADKIFVASSFTAATLKCYPGRLPSVEVIPYGFPPVADKRNYFTKAHKLKLLFVGSLSQRKGIADLFEAVNSFGNHVQLTVVGQKNVQCLPLETQLNKHKWIPSLSHSEILNLMRENDVLVFPSLFEGFGLVITEAMSQGMPVITTNRTAGPDIITHNKNGWLIDAGNIDQLKEAIEKILHDPRLVAIAGRDAIETARLRPWDVYGKQLAEAVILSVA